MHASPEMRLQHVGITVRPEEIDPARAFYGEALELPELHATERALVYGLGREGELELHVIAGPAADASAEHHFALEVAELEVARTRLAASGCEIADARPVGGRERFFVRDPFGNLIEFVTPRS
jgi:catechol 2,3-dioxygenase-like lactoylglutathione lyase family enzyme